MMREGQAMKLLHLASLLALLSSAGCAYHNPVEPGAAPIDLSVPFQVTLGALPGSGAQAGTATMTARVQNANGAALANVAVTFTTSLGTIAPALVATGVDGRATAMLAATDTADVTATVGKLSAHSLVVVQPPTPPAPTPTPAAVLAATLTCTPGTHGTTGTPTACNVSLTYGGAALPGSSVTSIAWDWGDGFTNTTVPPTAPVSSRVYVNAGTYTVIATVAATTVDGPRNAATSKV